MNNSIELIQVFKVFRLPKWAKISLVALSVVAFALLVATFALQSWADNKLESANLTFSKMDKTKSADLDNEYAYEARVHFARLDFLLRSKTISHIDLEKVAWESSIDSSAIQSIETHNRRLFFTTTQQLNLDSGANLGTMSYKMDFSPLMGAIVKYSLALIFIFLSAMLLHRFINLYESGNISLSFGQISLPQVLWQSYKNINPLYRHTFWIVFIACNIVFGFHTVQFLFGAEDWSDGMFNKHNIFDTAYQGRYTQNIISMFIEGAQTLPILNNLLSFFALSLASVWLCMYLNIQRKLWIWVIVGLMSTLQPFILARMWYAYQVAGLFIAVAIGILGFILAKKAGAYSATTQIEGGGNALYSKGNLKPYILCLISIFCIHWGIASYQPFIDTALILLCGGIITIIIDNNGNLKTSLYQSRFIVISVALSAISYKIMLDILKKFDIVQNVYNNQMTPLIEIPKKMFKAIEMGFDHLFAYNEPFMPMAMSVCFILFVIILLVLLVNIQLQKSAKTVIAILFIVMVVASQAHIVLAKNLSSGIVTEYYGLLFLRVLIVALVFKCIAQFIRTQILLQSLAFALSCVFIWICVVQDLEAQRVHKLAIDRDFRLINRIVDRIEQSEGFSYNKQYCGIMFGGLNNKTTRDFISDMFPRWYMKSMFMYILPKDIFKNCEFWSDLYEYHKTSQSFQNLILRLEEAGNLDKLKPFPHKDSIIVFEDIIVFMANRGNIDEIREMAKNIANEMGKIAQK